MAARETRTTGYVCRTAKRIAGESVWEGKEGDKRQAGHKSRKFSVPA